MVLVIILGPLTAFHAQVMVQVKEKSSNKLAYYTYVLQPTGWDESWPCMRLAAYVHFGVLGTPP